jgi:gliding motility-associated-like protein
MKIFDRWGQLIFESNDFDKGWNGKVNNVLAQQDVYVYHINITSDLGKYHKYYGTVTLLR